MTKSELLDWLRDEYRQWTVFLDQIGPERMEQPGVAGYWSVKDIVAHLTDWQMKVNAALPAAQRGEPEPPPPWPAHLQGDDEINAWIYASNRELPAREVLDKSDRVFQQYVTVIEGLPDDVVIELAGRLLRFGDRRFAAGEFFDHFHDDHEAEVRAWLAEGERH